MKLRCCFEMEIDVHFENPEAAEAYFINGHWKDVFYTLHTLDALAGSIAEAFHNEEDRWDNDTNAFYRSMEGYGRFCKQKDGTYQCCAETAREIGGYIVISYESELECTESFEI